MGHGECDMVPFLFLIYDAPKFSSAAYILQICKVQIEMFLDIHFIFTLLVVRMMMG